MLWGEGFRERAEDTVDNGSFIDLEGEIRNEAMEG
jgi:hypothetical protein